MLRKTDTAGDRVHWSGRHLEWKFILVLSIIYNVGDRWVEVGVCNNNNNNGYF